MIYLSSAKDTPMPSIGAWPILDFLGLLLNIFVYLFFSQSRSYTSYEISGNPNLTSPEIFLEECIVFEKKSCWNTFEDLHGSGRSNPWRRAYRHMGMVRHYLDFIDLHIILESNFSEEIFNLRFGFLIGEYMFSILCWKGYMIPKFISSMRGMYNSHGAIVSNRGEIALPCYPSLVPSTRAWRMSCQERGWVINITKKLVVSLY